MQHPNLTPIEGIAGRLDVPSLHTLALDYKKGTGSPGPGIQISMSAAMESLQTIPFAGINALTERFENFEPYTVNAIRRKCGFIIAASIEDDLIKVTGYIYAVEFPDVLAEIKRGGLGLCMSLTYPHIGMSELINGVIHPKVFICNSIGLMKKECCGWPDTEVKLSFSEALRPKEK
jgi:hypothetical protein